MKSLAVATAEVPHLRTSVTPSQFTPRIVCKPYQASDQPTVNSRSLRQLTHSESSRLHAANLYRHIACRSQSLLAIQA